MPERGTAGADRVAPSRAELGPQVGQVTPQPVDLGREVRHLGPEPFDIPPECSGLLFVFRVFDRVAYAILLNTAEPVVVGDMVRKP